MSNKVTKPHSEHCILMTLTSSPFAPLLEMEKGEMFDAQYCRPPGALSFLLYLKLARRDCRRDCSGEADTLSSVCVKQM